MLRLHVFMMKLLTWPTSGWLLRSRATKAPPHPPLVSIVHFCCIFFFSPFPEKSNLTGCINKKHCLIRIYYTHNFITALFYLVMRSNTKCCDPFIYALCECFFFPRHYIKKLLFNHLYTESCLSGVRAYPSGAKLNSQLKPLFLLFYSCLFLKMYP